MSDIVEGGLQCSIVHRVPILSNLKGKLMDLGFSYELFIVWPSNVINPYDSPMKLSQTSFLIELWSMQRESLMILGSLKACLTYLASYLITSKKFMPILKDYANFCKLHQSFVLLILAESISVVRMHDMNGMIMIAISKEKCHTLESVPFSLKIVKMIFRVPKYVV